MDATAKLRISFEDGTTVDTTVADFSEANSFFPEMVAGALSAVGKGEAYHDGGGSGLAFSIAAIEDEPEAPDISELVEAIREMVEASDEYLAAFAASPLDAHRAAIAHDRQAAAIGHLRTLLSDCDKAMEAFG